MLLQYFARIVAENEQTTLSDSFPLGSSFAPLLLPLTASNACEHCSRTLPANLAYEQEEIEQAILREWNSLQQVPSYVERLCEENRDLIEDVATQ